MHNQDRDVIINALDHATQSCGLSDALQISTQLASQCASADNQVDHPAWDQVADRISQMNNAQIADMIRVGTARFHLLN